MPMKNYEQPFLQGRILKVINRILLSCLIGLAADAVVLNSAIAHNAHGRTRILAKDEIVPIKKYSGVCRTPGLRKLSPSSGVINNQAKLEELWKTWSIPESIPKVDFTSQLVLVSTVDGPNRTMSGPLNLADGKLEYKVLSTRMGGPGFGYLLMLVKKDGIDQVNGVPLPADNEPELKEPIIEDSINVEVIGTVQTNVASIGGETTGVVIRANGVEWELDLQSALQRETATELNGKKARVLGSFFQLAGTEIATRNIVSVSSIIPAEFALKKKPVDLPAYDRTPPRETQPAQREMPAVNNTEQPELPVIDTSKLNAFSKIKVEVQYPKEGQSIIQEVNARGLVKNNANGEETSWQIAPTQLKVLHKVIETTNWKSIPKLNRTGVVGDDDASYSIQIVTPKGAIRLFLDRKSIMENKLIMRMFSMMKRPRAGN